MKKHHYGWRPDLPDHRDHLYSAPIEHLRSLPPSADLRPNCPPVMDQGQLGSCTANAIAAALQFDQIKQGLPSVPLARLFIYYNERAMEGTVDSDSGAMIRDGIKSVGSQGVCPESEWPYDITLFRNKPPLRCYTDALLDKALSYQRVVRSSDQMKACLSSGFPFVFGFSVYESFESAAQTGHVPMPGRREKILGGHCTLAVGYDDLSQIFYVQNSWGSVWGMNGFFTIPRAYLMNKGLASDFWTIRMVGK